MKELLDEAYRKNMNKKITLDHPCSDIGHTFFKI